MQLLGGTGLTGFSIWSILVATLGAIVLLALYRAFAGGRGGYRFTTGGVPKPPPDGLLLAERLLFGKCLPVVRYEC